MSITLEVPQTDNETLKTQVMWLNNRELVRFSEQRHRKHTINTQRKYVESFLDHPDNVLREIHVDGVMIGTISAYVDIWNRIADMGILIGAGWGGRGYGFQAWAKLGDIMFDVLGVRRIEAGCMADNLAMMKICKKYAMREEGRRPNHFIVDGRYSDLVIHGRFK